MILEGCGTRRGQGKLRPLTVTLLSVFNYPTTCPCGEVVQEPQRRQELLSVKARETVSQAHTWPQQGRNKWFCIPSLYRDALPTITWIGITRSCWTGVPSYPTALSRSTSFELLSWLLQGPQTVFPHVLPGMPQASWPL